MKFMRIGGIKVVNKMFTKKDFLMVRVDKSMLMIGNEFHNLHV